MAVKVNVSAASVGSHHHHHHHQRQLQQVTGVSDPGSGSGSWEVQMRALREERDALRREEQQLLSTELHNSRLWDTIETLSNQICCIIELNIVFSTTGEGGGASEAETRLLALREAVIGQAREEKELAATQQTLAGENAKLQEAKDLLTADIAQMKLDEEQVKVTNRVELSELASERAINNVATSLQEKRYTCATLRHRLQTWRTSQRTNESTASIRTWIAQQELHTTKMQIMCAAKERERVLSDIETVRQKTYRLLRLLDRRSNTSELINLLSILGFVTSSTGEVELGQSGSGVDSEAGKGGDVEEKDSLDSTVLSLQLSAELGEEANMTDISTATGRAEGGRRQAVAAEVTRQRNNCRRVQSEAEAETTQMRSSFVSTITQPFTSHQLASFKRRKVKWRHPPDMTRATTNGQGAGKGGAGVKVAGRNSLGGGKRESHDHPTLHRIPTRGEIRTTSLSTPGLRSSAHDRTELPVGWQRCGLMGVKIAGELAYHGHMVRMFDTNTKTLNCVFERIEDDKRTLKKEGILSHTNFVGQVLCFSQLSDALLDVEFVFEVVVEDLAVKQDLLQKVCQHVSSSAIIATNTLQLDVTAIADKCSAKERTLGLRFLFPVYYIPEVEITPNKYTSGECISRVRTLLERMGKTLFMRSGPDPLILNDEQREIRRQARMRELQGGSMYGNLRRSSENPLLELSHNGSFTPRPEDILLTAPEADLDCAICMDHPRDCVLSPCHHMVTCTDCAQSLLARHDSCPICRRQIQESIHVYRS